MASAEPGADDEAARRQALFDADGVPPHMGMRLEHLAPGTATVSLLPAPWMLNGASIVHGGITFTLADQAFGYAANAAGPLQVSHTLEISYLRPAFGGRRLVATAAERSRDEQGGIYDVAVRDEDERAIATVVARAARFVPR